MRITKADLNRRWLWSSVLALGVFTLLAFADIKLKSLSGLSTADLQTFRTAAQFRISHVAWALPPFAMRAGFNLGLDYLFMPLYAASFFYSGVIVRETFAPRPGRLRRILALAAMAPVAGAMLDAAENGVELWLVLVGITEPLARIAYGLSNAKLAAFVVGLVLLTGAVFAQVMERKKARPV